jgi:hypothetical protein
VKTKLVLIVAVCALVCPVVRAATGVSLYGTNPYLSYSLFPQDIRGLHSNYISYFPTYEQQPYWGDIDEPGNKPNGTYTSTGIKVINPDSRFFNSAQVHSVTNSFDYIHKFNNGPTASLALDYNVNSRNNKANGDLVDDSTGTHVPFDYSLSHTLNTLRLKGMAGFELFGAPAGIKVDGGFENTLVLDHHLDIAKGDSIRFSSDRALWGCTTSPCAHIFGIHGPQGDAWLQSGYAQGPMYNFDVQAGMTLPVAKMGGRFAIMTGHQDYYSWQSSKTDTTSDTTINKNFIGSYQKENWSRTTVDGIGQLYGNVPWIKGDRYSLNVFALLGYEGVSQGQALSANSNVTSDAKDKSHTVTLEVAPNISIPFIPYFSYIDAALHLEYRYGRYDNTGMVGVGNGQVEAHVDTRTSAADEYAWEGYSFANRNAFDFGIDLSTMFPLLNNGIDNVGIGLQLAIDSKFAFMTKYYGANVVQGSSVDFRVDNRRYDFERELYFGTGLKLQYMRRPFFAWLELTEPLLRSFTPRTSVTDASGKTVLYEHEKEPLWMSLEGLRVGLYVSVAWTLPLLKSL